MIDGYQLALSEAQVTVLAHGVGGLPEPQKFGLNDHGVFWMQWQIPGFLVHAAVTSDGTLTITTDTVGRIEDFPLVAALMKFVTMLYAVFAEDVYTGDQCLPLTTPPRTLPPSSSA